MNNTLETAQKCAQCAGMLVSDLRELLMACDAVAAMVVMEELHKACDISFKLNALVSALTIKGE